MKISGLTHKTCLLALFITLPVGPNAILLMNLKTFYIKQCWRDSLAVYLLTGDD